MKGNRNSGLFNLVGAGQARYPLYLLERVSSIYVWQGTDELGLWVSHMDSEHFSFLDY